MSYAPLTNRLVTLLLISTLAGCASVAPLEVKPSQKQVIEPVECTPPQPIEPVVKELAPPVPVPVCPRPKPQKCPVCPAIIVANKPVLGEYELVNLEPLGFDYLARIDTGATSTSIHASEIIRFERDGQKWVRFQLENPTNREPVILERKLVRKIRIKQAETGQDRRLVVMMTLRIGRIIKSVEVSLTDRSHLEYPVLIGRNFLLDAAVVDVSLRRNADQAPRPP